jgi:hypothetical protein
MLFFGKGRIVAKRFGRRELKAAFERFGVFARALRAAFLISNQCSTTSGLG